MKKEIAHCQHWAKAISSDIDAYPKEIFSLRHNLHRNNYPVSITSAPRNLERTIENDNLKIHYSILSYVKSLAKRIQKIWRPYDIRTILKSWSTFRKYLFRVKLPTEFDITKKCMYSIPCSCSKIYKGETCCQIRIRLEEHRKAVLGGEIEKSCMADHIWKEKWNHLGTNDQKGLIKIIFKIIIWVQIKIKSYLIPNNEQILCI